MNIVYADNNATTSVAPEVFEAMRPYLQEQFFNPSAMYDQAQGTAEALTAARAQVAAILGGVSPTEISFTSGATESNNTAIRGAATASRRNHIITSTVEHPAVLEVCRHMERNGCEVSCIPVDTCGNLDMNAYIRALRDDTLLVTIMHANNETGVVFPIADIARIAKETDPGIIVHTDATQSVGKLPLDLTAELQHVDMLSLSGHKCHAPKGVGALFMRRGTRCRPLMLGGHQENGRRAGTENVASIAGLGAACDLAAATLADEQRVAAMRDRLEGAIRERIPHVEVNGAGAPRLPNTLNLAVHYVEGEAMLYQLSAAGICVSSGSACTSGSLDPSHVLKAMQIPFTALHGSVRFSFSRYNTDDDIDHIINVFPDMVRSLRRLSPYWDNANDSPADGDLP